MKAFLFCIILLIANCSKQIRQATLSADEVVRIRNQAKAEAYIQDGQEFHVNEERAQHYRNQLFPPNTMMTIPAECPFITRPGHGNGDGIMRVEMNCGVNHGWGNVMVFGMLCSPGYYSPGSQRYRLPEAPINTLYDKEMHFYLTSEAVCKSYRGGIKYKGTIYRDAGDEGMITIIRAEPIK